MLEFCTNCGAKATPTRFCGHCGQEFLSAPISDEPAAGWTCLGGGPGHANFNAHETAINRQTIGSLREKWRLPIPGGVTQQPIIVGDRLFVATPPFDRAPGSSSRDGGLHGIDAEAGLLIWRNATTGRYNSNNGDVVGSPTFFDGHLYCQYDLGAMIRLNPQTGDPETAQLITVGSQIDCPSAPTIFEGSCFQTDWGTLFRFFLADVVDAEIPRANGLPPGSLSIDTEAGELVGAPAIDTGCLYVLSADRLRLFNPFRFDVSRSIEFPRALASHLQPDGELGDAERLASIGCVANLGYAAATISVFSWEQDRHLYSLLLCASGEANSLLWAVESEVARLTDPAIAYGMAFFADSEGALHALDLESGNVRWSTWSPARAAIQGRPLVANGMVFFGDEAGFVAAVDAATGEPVWHHDIGSPAIGCPAIWDGYLYIGSQSGMHAFELGPTSNPANGPWSQGDMPSFSYRRVDVLGGSQTTGTVPSTSDQGVSATLIAPGTYHASAIGLAAGLYRTRGRWQLIYGMDQDVVHLEEPGLYQAAHYWTDDVAAGTDLLLIDDRATLLIAETPVEIWPCEPGDIVPALESGVEAGTYLVGRDVAPGRYSIAMANRRSPGFIRFDNQMIELEMAYGQYGNTIEVEIQPTDFAVCFYGELRRE